MTEFELIKARLLAVREKEFDNSRFQLQDEGTLRPLFDIQQILEAVCPSVQGMEKLPTELRPSNKPEPLQTIHQQAKRINDDIEKETRKLAYEIYLKIIGNQKVLVDDAPNTVELSYTLAKAFLEHKG